MTQTGQTQLPWPEVQQKAREALALLREIQLTERVRLDLAQRVLLASCPEDREKLYQLAEIAVEFESMLEYLQPSGVFNDAG